MRSCCARIRNNQELKSDERTKMLGCGDDANDRLLASVTIDRLAIEDSGEIIAVATNSVGQAFSTAKLIVNGIGTYRRCNDIQYLVAEG